MIEILRALWVKSQTEEDGATAVEYGLMVALIAAIIVGIVGTLGGQVQAAFQAVSDAL
jgi:pilus assembly protein Flp/PilA